MTSPEIDLDDPDIVDVGKDHIIRIMYTDDTETDVAALVLMHPHKEDNDLTCQGFAEVGPGEWEIVTRDPLTIWPSFVCSDCGDHGIVIRGKWHESQFDTSNHVMPVWLQYAFRAFCENNEEINHVYRRPIPYYGYRSPRDLVINQDWNMLCRWLEEMGELKKKSVAAAKGDTQ